MPLPRISSATTNTNQKAASAVGIPGGRGSFSLGSRIFGTDKSNSYRCRFLLLRYTIK